MIKHKLRLSIAVEERREVKGVVERNYR